MSLQEIPPPEHTGSFPEAILLLLVWLIGIRVWRWSKAKLPPRPEADVLRWPLRFLLVVMILFLGTVVLVDAVKRLTGVELSTVGLWTVQSAVNVTTSILSFLILRSSYSVKPRDVGIRWDRPVLHGGFGIATYVTFVPAVLLSLIANEWIYRSLGRELDKQDVLKMLESVSGTSAFVWLAILAVIVIPLTEEFLFRGILLSTLRQRFGHVVAILGSSFLFAIPHDAPVRLPVFVLGIILGYAYHRADSLVASSAIHVLHNGLQIAMLILTRTIGGS